MRDLHKINQRHVTAEDALRLYQAYARFGWDCIGRTLDCSRTAGEQMGDSVARGLLGPWAPGQVLREIGQDYADLALGLMAVPVSALGAAVAARDAPDSTLPDAVEKALSGSAPSPTSSPVTLRPTEAEDQIRFLADRAGDSPRDFDFAGLAERVADRFLLPARVLDASQAWASWFVPVATARRLMEEAVRLGHQPQEALAAFEPAVVGGRDTMVSLVATDYRASDFGVLKEIGLTLSVTPRGGGFPDPGQMFLRLIVTDPYSLVAARRIWGIRKDLWDTQSITPRSVLDAAYSETQVRFGLGAKRPGTDQSPDRLAMEFPRFGRTTSRANPGGILSMIEPDGVAPGTIRPARSTFTRSGEGEGVQFGGPVRLLLPDSRERGQDGGCLCSSGMACLCESLRGLGLDQTRPAANGWTERMSGTLGKPATLR